MNLSTFITKIETSSPGDWHKTQLPTAALPWKWGNLSGFDTLAVYMDDIDISVVMSGTLKENYAPPWTQNGNIPDQKATLVAILLRYRESVIKIWKGVLVDGSRYLIPVPDLDEHQRPFIRTSCLPMGKLFFILNGHPGILNTIEEVLTHAGIRIENDIPDETEEN